MADKKKLTVAEALEAMQRGEISEKEYKDIQKKKWEATKAIPSKAKEDAKSAADSVIDFIDTPFRWAQGKGEFAEKSVEDTVKDISEKPKRTNLVEPGTGPLPYKAPTSYTPETKETDKDDKRDKLPEYKSTADEMLRKLDAMAASKYVDPSEDKDIIKAIHDKKKDLERADSQAMIESIVHGITKIAQGLYAKQHGLGVTPLDLKPQDWESRKRRIERLYDSEIQARRSFIKDGNLKKAREASEQKGFALRLFLRDLDAQAKQADKVERKEEKLLSTKDKARNKALEKRKAAYDEAKKMAIVKGDKPLTRTEGLHFSDLLSQAGVPDKMAKEAVKIEDNWGWWADKEGTGEQAYEAIRNFKPGSALDKGAERVQNTKEESTGLEVGKVYKNAEGKEATYLGNNQWQEK